MLPGRGKRKGGSFEAMIAKKLSLWVSNGANEDLLWRSSMSGGRATIAQRAGRLIKPCGDLCSIHPDGHLLTDLFFIECKHVKKLSLDNFLMKNSGPLAIFWQIAKTQALSHSRFPMLIARENRMPILVITRKGDLSTVCGIGPAITMDPEVRPLEMVLSKKFERWSVVGIVRTT